MFDLEQSIADWRNRMSAHGITNSAMLDELESHLRDDIEQQARSRSSGQQAFEVAVRRIGQAEVLKSEFAKVGGTFYERLKQLFCTLAGIQDYQLATNMNTSQQNTEPRWASYFKTTAFILPAILLWVGSCVFVLPKLKHICEASNTAVPKPMVTALAVSELFKNHLFVASIVIIIALVLLEWRSSWWERRRRLVFGIAAFLLNSIAVILITTMFVLAVIAGANLLQAK